ncbi:hypothetical protein K470DRAFT_26391 [Piedraia hortae CBS 480.64]|uniref:Uncharacterized protein n=1 Tax=Piedraia hortae CBS 480.64 TaxID=1314780 RepID=A0A6A7C3M0_9PEZI|nr:hypothetical protein K470DRAFT_26391 [Piedraia hortae CBS 480.64]
MPSITFVHSPTSRVNSRSFVKRTRVSHVYLPYPSLSLFCLFLPEACKSDEFPGPKSRSLSFLSPLRSVGQISPQSGGSLPILSCLVHSPDEFVLEGEAPKPYKPDDLSSEGISPTPGGMTIRDLHSRKTKAEVTTNHTGIAERVLLPRVKSLFDIALPRGYTERWPRLLRMPLMEKQSEGSRDPGG